MKKEIKVLLNLNDLEFKILNLLEKVNKELPAKEIAKMLKMDRTSIQKAVKKLSSKETPLIICKQENLERGYRHNYQLKLNSEIKQYVLNKIEDKQEELELLKEKIINLEK